MALTKEKIANWIEDRFANDYFRFDLICSPVEVLDFKQDGPILEVNYQFWDDGHASDTQQDVIFDLAIGKEYGVNFPAQMQLVNFNDRYTWPTEEDCLNLNTNFSDDMLDTNITYIEWGDPRVEEWIDHYFSVMDKESMKDMLIEKYDATNGLPDCIPERLRAPFNELLATTN